MTAKKTVKTVKKLTKKQLAEVAEDVKKENRRIARENAKFEKLTAKEKRVQIARDVLAQLALKRLVPTPGVWLNGKSGEGHNTLYTEKDINKDRQLQDVLKGRKTCTGCALGGMFMCAVERANELKISDLNDADEGIDFDDAMNYLGRFFDGKQLEMIETAFERGDGATSAGDEALEFCENVEDASERMRLVMENIVVNGGKFVPTKRPKVTYVTPGFTG
jgi:hypothetical protein